MRRPILEKSLLALGALIAFGSSLAPAHGAFIATETTSVVQLANSSYLYSYTVTVAATSTDSASEFDLSLGAPIDPNSIVSPSNFFTFYTVGDPFITFTGTASATGFDGITPGSSGTFSFTSMVAPVMGSYQVLGLDPSFNTATIQGMTLTPGVVPEPSSLLLTGLGACGALGAFARSRRRSSVPVG